MQTAVYWGNPVDDGYGGMTYDDPVEIPCRWEDVSELVTAADGEQYVTKAQILTPNDLEVNGYLMLGELTDLNSDQSDSPDEVLTAHRIRRIAKTPLFRKTDKFVKEVSV